MELKSKIRSLLRESYGDFKTDLEYQYRDKITEALLVEDLKNRKEWVTYNQVLLEFKHTLKDQLRVSKLLYKLTDDGEPNKACIEVIKEVEIRTPELDRLYFKIMNFGE